MRERLRRGLRHAAPQKRKMKGSVGQYTNQEEKNSIDKQGNLCDQAKRAISYARMCLGRYNTCFE